MVSSFLCCFLGWPNVPLLIAQMSLPTTIVQRIEDHPVPTSSGYHTNEHRGPYSRSKSCFSSLIEVCLVQMAVPYVVAQNI
jgi:hypothetical protein